MNEHDKPYTQMFLVLCVLIGAWQIGTFIGGLLVEMIER
jgi:hypothetical protein